MSRKQKHEKKCVTIIIIIRGSALCCHSPMVPQPYVSTFLRNFVFLIFPFKLCPILPQDFLEAFHSKQMSNYFPQYLVKSIADRDRVGLGLGLTLAQWVRFRVRARLGLTLAQF